MYFVVILFVDIFCPPFVLICCLISLLCHFQELAALKRSDGKF